MAELSTAPITLPGASGMGESTASAVSWPAVFAGATVAIAATLIFVALGAGFGAAALSPWPNMGAGIKTFSAVTGVWLVVTQWVASGLGGYLTGRMRVRWHGLHTHEVFFRDTANGLIAWALATLVVAALGVAAGLSDTAGTAVQTAASVAGPPSDVAIDAARKATAAFSVFTGISMLVGAFIASVAAALGGQQRDEHL